MMNSPSRNSDCSGQGGGQSQHPGAGPPSNTDDNSDSEDLEPFWEKLNAARGRAMERMQFSSWESLDQPDNEPAPNGQINQV